MRSKFLRFGKWIGAAAIGTSLITVVNCSTQWNTSNPSVVPDGFPKWDYNWDKREPYSLIKPSKRNKSASDEEKENKLESKKAKAVRHILLIRHGQYVLKGATDCEKILTPLGQQQAALTGERLKSLEIKFTSLLCSDMTRAIETTEIVKANLNQPGLEISTRDPLLREGAPILPEPPVSHWHPDQHQYFEDGARIEAAFRKYFHRAPPDQCEDSYEIIVCHANVIRYFICRALQFPGEAWLRISLNHTSLSCLSILPSGRVILRSIGDSGHLPIDKLTTS